jgi:hypothetical protein
MSEPINRWKPITVVYKEQATISAAAEAENQQKLHELHESGLRKPWTQGKAPLGIRIFTWYYFLRAGVCALLLFVIATFPQSAPSALLSDSISNFLHMPGSKSEQEARKKAIEKVAKDYAVPENAIVDEEPVISPETVRNMVMVYLLVNLAVASVVGFMWWNRSEKVRWVTMFLTGALVAKALINFIAGAASGVGSGIAPSQTPILLLVLGMNGIIFLYLAFGYGVKQWFEPGLYQ